VKNNHPVANSSLHTDDIGYLDEEAMGFIVDRLKDKIICSRQGGR